MYVKIYLDSFSSFWFLQFFLQQDADDDEENTDSQLEIFHIWNQKFPTKDKNPDRKRKSDRISVKFTLLKDDLSCWWNHSSFINLPLKSAESIVDSVFP